MLCPWNWALSPVLVCYNLVLLQLKGEEKSFVKKPPDAMQTSLKGFGNICSIMQCIKRKSKDTRYELCVLFYMALWAISLKFQTNPGYEEWHISWDVLPWKCKRKRESSENKVPPPLLKRQPGRFWYFPNSFILHTLVHPFGQSKQL